MLIWFVDHSDYNGKVLKKKKKSEPSKNVSMFGKILECLNTENNPQNLLMISSWTAESKNIDSFKIGN